MSLTTITPEELAAQMQSGENIELIDVRTPAEFQELHAVLARNVPLDRLDVAEFQRYCAGSDPRPIYLVCHSGSRSAQACQKLSSAGIGLVVSVAGGTQAWEAAGLPVVRGRKTISLERQVRIAAGTLVLAGVLLGVGLHPYFYLLSAAIGGGLIFAGVTDSCGLGLLLSRMPWNQTRNSCSR